MELNDTYLRLSLELFEKLPSQQIISISCDEIPDKISEILSRCLGKDVRVSGNGIDSDMCVITRTF